MEKWRVKESRVVLSRRWLTVHEQRIALPQGGEIDEFHLLESPDWVAVVALTKDGDVLLVDQYRHGAGRTSRELPAGVIDPGETPLVAAQRELAEETGYRADDWQALTVFSPEPSRSTSRAHFYVARGAYLSGAPDIEPTENIQVHKLTPHDLLAALDRGEIVHAAHVAALLYAARRGFLPAE